MLDGDDYIYDAELMEDKAEEHTAYNIQVYEYATYQRWDPISERVYPNVTITECAVKGDDAAERYYSQYPENFEHDVCVLAKMYNAQSINFRVTAVDYENGAQFDVNLRVDVIDGSIVGIAEHIRRGTASAYSGASGSDNVTGLNIIWKLGWIQFIRQQDVGDTVTVVVGESMLFPGYVTKVINTLDHHVNYSSTDCVFICLNEATGQRHSPVEVRGLLFDARDMLAPIDIRRDMARIARHYGCNIHIHSIDDDSKLIASRDQSLPLVRLVRMGAAIGIIDRRIYTASEPIAAGTIAHAYYDLETVSNSTATQVYSFASIWPSNRRLYIMHHDSEVVASSVREGIKDMLDCLPDTIKTVHLHAWNGSRFDHPLLLNMCNAKFKVSFVIMNSQREVLSATIGYNGRSIVLRDPCKMMPGSLQSISKLFGATQGKLELNHVAVENAYLSGQLEQYLQLHKQTTTDYATRDVELLKATAQNVMRMYKESGLEYNVYLTRSMASYALWHSNLTAQDRVHLSSIQFNYNDSIRFMHNTINIEQIKDEAIAGRVQGIRGEYTQATLLDFKSMYPSVAANESYPCGDYYPTMHYVPGKLGLYIVKITQQSHPHVVPFRLSKKDAYNWNHTGDIIKLITSVDVECLLESGAMFEIHDGIVWGDSFNCFASHMNKLYNARTTYKQQDMHTMAEHCKHMANSLTGGLFQQLRREYVKVFSGKNEADIYLKMHAKYIQLTYELVYDNGQIMLFFYPKKLTNTHDLQVQRDICKGALGSKPVIATMFIYAYGRAKLWRTWRQAESSGTHVVVYCDTDSLAIVPKILSASQHQDALNRLSQHIGTEMGMLEIVVYNAQLVVVSPKVYAMRDANNIDRVRIRGVNAKDKLYLLAKDMKWLIREIKEGGWEYAKRLHDETIGRTQVQLTYDAVRALLHSYVLMSAHWYYARVQGQLQKKYNVMIIEG